MSYTNENTVYPKMYRVKQRLNNEKIADIPAEVFNQLESIGLRDKIKNNGEIGVCIGSRGINNIAIIVKATCDYVRHCGGQPFILPAMGSHGGATAQGQKQVSEKFGVTEEAMGCEIRSSMETVQFENTALGTPVYFDKIAMESDGVIVINRVKPHTDFTAKNESGIVKMLSVGLGKQKGASAMHDNGLSKTIPLTAGVILKNAPILAGVGIVENAKDETYIIKAVKPENFIEEDAKMLEISYGQVPKLPCEDIDILIVKEIGKQYSGTGMDTKVVGRMKIFGEQEPVVPRINKLVALRISKDSYGNALGIGLADLTVKKLVDTIDYEAMYSNLVTTTFLERGKVPVHFNTEKESIDVAFRTCGGVETEKARVMIIENTLHLGTVLVSEAIYTEIKDNVELVDENVNIVFNSEGVLLL
ncbi:MAG: lactate racemase domain-containing protein [Anaerotignaceae bacterium]